ncbi:protein A20 [Aotine betaherpesvirus 1]|uniref:Protein A20 n=1 Tax=Aotine betaherpesvirus 1 TaxID=50290 RepID=G8XUA3_9BETA|nr:protein A20 [Aotine betaherpesvirus 1]AEV80734.1 protein A20 [Aotine betaherpesvirus 1]
MLESCRQLARKWGFKTCISDLLGIVHRSSRDTFRETLLTFIHGHPDGFVLIYWPQDVVYLVGPEKLFGIDSWLEETVQSFELLQQREWVLFGGVIRTDDNWFRHRDVWVLFTSAHELLTFDPVARLLWRVDGWRYGILYLSTMSCFYDMRFHSRRAEQIFGMVPSRSEGAFLCRDFNYYWLMAYVTRHAGFAFNPADGCGYVVGTAMNPEAVRGVSPTVLRCLREAGYEVIGRTQLYERVILVDVHCNVYALLPGSYLFTLANTFRGFLRAGLKFMVAGRRFCFTAIGSSFVPVGKRVPFPCQARYSLPGDDELMRHLNPVLQSTRHGRPARG